MQTISQLPRLWRHPLRDQPICHPMATRIEWQYVG
jgi:hypothetical protein